MIQAVGSSELGFETTIWMRTLDPANPEWSPETARALANFSFSPQDHRRMSELVAKSGEGTISVREEGELDGYRRVARVLDLIHAKALYTLRNQEAMS